MVTGRLVDVSEAVNGNARSTNVEREVTATMSVARTATLSQQHFSTENAIW